MFQVTVVTKRTVSLDIPATGVEEARETIYNMSHEELDEYIEESGSYVEYERTVTEVRSD